MKLLAATRASVVLAFLLSACTDASDANAPPDLPLVTEHERGDGQVPDLVFPENFSYPYRLIVYDVHGQVVSDEVVEHPESGSEPPAWTSEDDAQAREWLLEKSKVLSEEEYERSAEILRALGASPEAIPPYRRGNGS